MLVPDWLYKFTSATHQGSQPIEVVHADGTAGAASVSVNALVYTVPGDFILLLTNACGLSSPGGAQVTTNRQWYTASPDGTQAYVIARDDTDGGAGAQVALNWQGEVWIPPTWQVRYSGAFSAGVSDNTQDAWLHGVLIPRGSIAWRG